MADPQKEKERITAELMDTRTALSDQALLVHQNLDVGRRLSDSLRSHSWGWISMAAIFGWLLSRLPARTKKIYIHTQDSKKTKIRSMGLLGHMWKGVWSIARPVITAYLTKRIAAKALGRG